MRGPLGFAQWYTGSAQHLDVDLLTRKKDTNTFVSSSSEENFIHHLWFSIDNSWSQKKHKLFPKRRSQIAQIEGTVTNC